MTTATISTTEAAHFGALAVDWWNPKGSSAMLHKLNPVRLGYIRAQINLHFGVDAKALRPLTKMTALDVGCGAGLLTEPLARMGADVTGVDAAPENIAVAKAHAAGQGLSIDYRACEVADLDQQTRSSRAKSRDASGVSTSLDTNGDNRQQFDLITVMEVIEHVTDPAAFIAALSARLAAGGLMILSTPNRTALSRLGLITVAEGLGQIPKGTHDWDKFLTPEELTVLLADAGLAVIDTRGISFNLGRGLMLSDDVKLNYLMSVVAA
jgi:2-polyprenyl-6-hydroxyphenyl methylase / 3-demethylubiquinone-9 3-methyltransferase